MPVGVKTIRTRPIVFKRPMGRLKVYNYTTGKYVLDAIYVNDISGMQHTASEGHAFPGRPGKLKDLGGPFRTSKNHVFYDGSTTMAIRYLKNRYAGADYNYAGPVFPIPAIPSKNTIFSDRFPPTKESSDVFLNALGTKAIALCKPTNSIADLSVTLAELKREGLPALIGAEAWKSRAKSLREKSRAAGGEYLNYQFGWAPLVGDVKNAINAAETADKVISQFQRDAGRVVRRRYKFPRTTIVEPTVSTTYAGYPSGPSGALHTGLFPMLARGYTTRMTRTIEQDRWFSGAFTYHLPMGNTTLDRIGRAASEARKLYGLSIDPEVIWNLLPWSWAVDWAVNIGDVLSNASDAMTDGLVMPYGYMMEHTIVTDTYETDLSVYGLGHVSMSFVTETKKRVKASPYGFGLTWESFSPYQISILAALGISRR